MTVDVDSSADSSLYFFVVQIDLFYFFARFMIYTNNLALFSFDTFLYMFSNVRLVKYVHLPTILHIKLQLLVSLHNIYPSCPD